MSITLTALTLECPEQYICSYLISMPISMLKTYDSDWKRNGQGIDGTLRTFSIFCLFNSNTSGLSIAILKFIKFEWEFYSNRYVFIVWFRLEK